MRQSLGRPITVPGARCAGRTGCSCRTSFSNRNLCWPEPELILTRGPKQVFMRPQQSPGLWLSFLHKSKAQPWAGPHPHPGRSRGPSDEAFRPSVRLSSHLGDPGRRALPPSVLPYTHGLFLPACWNRSLIWSQVLTCLVVGQAVWPH